LILDKKHIYALIMAGGKGERFWPYSRLTTPKQTLDLFGRYTLIQQSWRRLASFVLPGNIFVATNRQQLKLIKNQLPEISNSNIISEPIPRNTAACIGLVSMLISQRNSKAVLIVSPADHSIKPVNKFKSDMRIAVEVASSENVLITFGVKPQYAATGYGYIELANKREDKVNWARRFVEKPGIAQAKKFIASKRFLWNSGIFVFRTKEILDEFKKKLPSHYKIISRICQSSNKRNFLNRLAKEYRKFENISIDYGVMEKVRRIKVIRAGFNWDDLGSWNSLLRIFKTDKKGNVFKGKTVNLDTKNCVVVSDNEHLLATVDVEGLIVVHCNDATLVCRVESDQKVKALVHFLSANPKFDRYLK
jgi:mannose-1-phosphate guanylyltransferase